MRTISGLVSATGLTAFLANINPDSVIGPLAGLVSIAIAGVAFWRVLAERNISDTRASIVELRAEVAATRAEVEVHRREKHKILNELNAETLKCLLLRVEVNDTLKSMGLPRKYDIDLEADQVVQHAHIGVVPTVNDTGSHHVPTVAPSHAED